MIFFIQTKTLYKVNQYQKNYKETILFISILDLFLFSPPNLPEQIGNDIALKNLQNKLHFPPSNINMFFMDDLRFLFILLKLVIIYFVHQQKRRATLRTMRRAQKGLEFTQVVVVTVALRMQSNCSCPFKENLSNLKKDRYTQYDSSFYQINGYIDFNDTPLHHHRCHIFQNL